MMAQAAARPAPEGLLAGVERLRTELGRRIIGQDAVIDEVLMALLAGGLQTAAIAPAFCTAHNYSYSWSGYHPPPGSAPHRH